MLPEKMEQLYKEGRIVITKSGMPRRKRYLDEMPGLPLQDVWTDVNPVNSQALESTEYATQKPEALIERILNASSNEGDLVLDCFCGSGTTAAVAEKLNRRWIACDLGRFAIHTTRKRLLGISNVKPFVVQNLGKYERQQWQVAEFAPSPVILSGVGVSRSEAPTQSKDPVSAGAQHRPGEEFSERISNRAENALPGQLKPPAARGPSTPRPFAPLTAAPLRMTELKGSQPLRMTG